MLNFQWESPTNIRFGRGCIDQVGNEAVKIADKVLLVTGRTSARRFGVLHRVMESLERAGVTVELFEAIEPNPRTETIDRGGRLARERKCELVIGLGGGSVMDAAKAISTVTSSGIPCSEYLTGNHTELWRTLLPIQTALPIFTIPTLAATGSEANNSAVLTNELTKVKSSMSGPALYPRVAFLDPELTFTVSAAYTADGVVDIFTHLYEPYLTGLQDSRISDLLTEGLMRSVVENGSIAYRNPTDYQARAELMWASTLALMGITSAGNGGRFPLHPMEHVLSAWYDISHGRGLAILAPAYFARIAEDRPERLARMGRMVFQIGEERDKMAALQMIQLYREWVQQMNVPLRLRDLGIARDSLEPMAEEAVRIGSRGRDFLLGTRRWSVQEVLRIYEDSY